MLDIWPRDTTVFMYPHQRAAPVRDSLSISEGGGVEFLCELHSGLLRKTEKPAKKLSNQDQGSYRSELHSGLYHETQ